MVELATQHSLIVAEDKMVILGKHEISFKEIKAQFNKLYKEEFAEEAYSKIDTHCQIASILFTLFKMFPTHKKDADLQNLYRISLEQIRKDETKMIQIKRMYNDLANDFNACAFDVLADPQDEGVYLHRLKSQHPQGAIHLEFLNEFLQLPLKPSDYIGKTILSREYNLKNRPEHTDACEEYNYCATAFHREIEKRKDWNRLVELNTQLNPNNLTGLFFDKMTLQVFQQEKQELEKRITQKPVEDVVFESLKSNSIRLAASLGIILTAPQKAGVTPLPLYGKDLDLQLQIPPPRSVSVPYLGMRFNMTTSWLNCYRKVKELSEKKAQLREQLILNISSEAFKGLEQLEKEERELLQQKGVKSFVGDNFPKWLRENEGLSERRLSQFLVDHSMLHFVELTPSQILGDEYLPYFNPDELPIPEINTIKKEIQNFDPWEIRERVQNWPEHWLEKRREVLPELKEYFPENDPWFTRMSIIKFQGKISR